MSKEHYILSVQDLSVFYQPGDLTVLEKISFSLSFGESLAVVGESGSGKTTLANALMQLLDHFDGFEMVGKIIYNDCEIFPLAEADINTLRGAKIGMIFQEAGLALNPVFRVGNQVAEAIRYHQRLPKKESKERVLNIFNDLGLKPKERIYTAYPHELSGGMKQRVMIALAICCNPELIIADEPTSSLDSRLKHEIMCIISKARKQLNAGLLFITHDLRLAAQYSDKVLILQSGRIVDYGRVKDILENSNNEYAKFLRESIKANAKELESIAIERMS